MICLLLKTTEGVMFQNVKGDAFICGWLPEKALHRRLERKSDQKLEATSYSL